MVINYKNHKDWSDAPYDHFFHQEIETMEKAAILLLKGIDERLSLPNLRYERMDAGYDYEPIYKQVHQMGHQSVIAYNKRNESETIGFNKHFAPTLLS